MTIRSIKTKTTIINNQNLERKVFWLVFSVFSALFAYYGYLTFRVVFNIMARTNMDNYSKVLVSEIGRLEIERLALGKGINMDYSKKLGFKEPEKIYFATPSSGASSLSFNR